MLRAEDALAYGEDGTGLLLGLGVFPLGSKGFGKIVATGEGIGVLRAEKALSYGEYGAILFLRFGELTLGFQGDGKVVPIE